MAWTKEELLSDLRKVGSLYNEEQDPRKKEELSNFLAHMYDIVADFYYEDPITVHNEQLFFNALYALPKYDIYLPYINDFLIIAEENDIDFDHQVKADSPGLYSKPLVYDLSRKFYESVGGKTYQSFLEFDKVRDHFVDFCDAVPSDSATFCVHPLNKYYINVGNRGDARYVLEAYIHELAHVITCMQHHDRYYSTDHFTEIESLFYEILADQFLREETGDEYFSELEKFKLSRYYKLGRVLDIYGYALGDIMSRIDKVEKPNKEFLKICRKEGYSNPEKHDIDKTFKYVVSYICAVELAEIYKQDKETALHLLDTIVTKDNNKTEFERIVTTITPNEHTDGYVKRLKREN